MSVRSMRSCALGQRFMRLALRPQSSEITVRSTSGLLQRTIHCSRVLNRIQPYILADIGEGITECQIVSWYVKPGDQVAQFDPICEVQSDKATVEVTSRYDGIIKTLHYEQDDTAMVGKPLLDMDMLEESSEASKSESAPANTDQVQTSTSYTDEAEIATGIFQGQQVQEESPSVSSSVSEGSVSAQARSSDEKPKAVENAPLLTPAVRHLLRQSGIEPSTVEGTGKDGRITKDDVIRYMGNISENVAASPPAPTVASDSPRQSTAAGSDQTLSFNPIERQMFKVMTRSLAIPHFLYTQSIDITALNMIRQEYNQSHSTNIPSSKLSVLPFIIKAVSQAFVRYPRLNSHLTFSEDETRPQLVVRSAHHFGIAVETPQGLLVPVVRDVQSRSVESIAHELKRLADLGRNGKLLVTDFQDATFTVSNIGSIGGDVVNPVIVSPMVGIIGIGRVRSVLALETDVSGSERVVKQDHITLSWSADHRVLDGATVARTAEVAGNKLKAVGSWITSLA